MLITVSVLGLSGSDSIKGSVGVGKSLLCNRFVRPEHDDFYTEHISTLSQADFSGSPVINGKHWLFWGDRLFSDSLHGPVLIRVIEQSEFVDDETFSALPGASAHGETGYIKRATKIRLESPDKLMYICKEQLGLEADFEQYILPDGRAEIDAFLFVYDISVVTRRPFERQSDIAAPIIAQAAKTKRPIVVVASKSDEANPEGRKALERLLGRKEIRQLSLPWLETSALLNVNIEAAFSLLIHQVTKCRCRQKLYTFGDQLRQQNELHQLTRRRYVTLLREMMPLAEWPTKRASWSSLCTKLGLARHPYFLDFCAVFGRVQAQKLYRQYVNEAREHWMQMRLQTHLPKLTQVFAELIDRDSLSLCWAEVAEMIRQHPLFDEYFQSLGGLVADLDPTIPGTSDTVPVIDGRLPAELLMTPDAEAIFLQYVNLVEAEQRRSRLEDEFLALLAQCGHVTPGKRLSDVQLFLRGQPSFESLAEQDVKAIYQRYQTELVQKAEQEFMELLLEEVDLFVEMCGRDLNSPAQTRNRPMIGLDEKHMKQLREVLQEDIRYRRLNGLFEQRDKMLGCYASFISYPLAQNCPAGGARCVDTLAEQVISQTPRFDQFDPNGLNPMIELAVSGAERIVEEFIALIQDLLPDECYETAGGAIVRVLCTRSTSPPRCSGRIRVQLLNDRNSLDFIGASSAFAPIIVLCCDPRKYEDVQFLIQQGAVLAESSGGNFIVGRSAGDAALECSRCDFDSIFSRDQLLSVLETAACRVTESRSRISDLHILLCVMCGDSFTPQSLLSSLLAGAKRCSQTNSGATTSIEITLPSSKQIVRIDIRVQALHTSMVAKPSPITDGLIIAFSARRPASFAHARAVARRIARPQRQRTLIAAVADVVDFFKDQRTNKLLTAGNELAQTLGASFATVSANGDRSSAITYLDFFERLYAMRNSMTSADYMSHSDIGGHYWSNNSTADSKITRLSDCTTTSAESVTSSRHNGCKQDARYRVVSSRTTMSPDEAQSLARFVAAPLATPELEVAVDYSLIQDKGNRSEEEHIYEALDFLTDQSMDRESTSSRGSNLSPYSSYENSRPSTRRRVSESYNDRMRKLYLNSENTKPTAKDGGIVMSASFVGAPLISSKSAGALHSTTVTPTSEEEENEDEEEENRTGLKHRLVRKLKSSFRFRKQPKISAATTTDKAKPESGSKSVPHSPQVEKRSPLSVAPAQSPRRFTPTPKSRLSSGRATSSFSWLPSLSPKQDRNSPTAGSPVSRNESGVGRPNSPIVIDDPELIDMFIRKCIDYIEKEGGLKLEGLYRVPGNQAQVLELERALQEERTVEISSLDLPVHAVATALKNFIAALQEPLIPYALHDKLLSAYAETANDENEAAKIIGEILQNEMTTVNRDLLQFFTEHMQRVSRASSATSMDLRNLAKVWWPTLFRPNFDSFESMAAAVTQFELLTQFLFRRSKDIFRATTAVVNGH